MPAVFGVRVSRELKERMRRLADVNWSEVARRAREARLIEEEGGAESVEAPRIMDG